MLRSGINLRFVTFSIQFKKINPSWAVKDSLDTRPKPSYLLFLPILALPFNIKQLIILVDFALMVIRLIAQVFAFLKKVLTHYVQPYTIEIFTQSCQFPHSQKFRLIQFSNWVFLRQVHRRCFATDLNTAKRRGKTRLPVFLP